MDAPLLLSFLLIVIFPKPLNAQSESTPPPLNTSLPGSWQFQGCLHEPDNGRVFQVGISFPSNNTVTNCLNLCSSFGYSAAGPQYGLECWCGDVTDIAAHNGYFVADDQCNMACTGDRNHSCGGYRTIDAYYWPNKFTWHTPSNTGHFEFLIPGVVVPVATAVSINNKVVLLEKHGSGRPPNTTGAYELDLTLSHDFNHAYREMHPKTDLFCGANIVLPDKVGRQLIVGGYNNVSLSGVRLYTPDGSAGVNGTNDWEEDYTVLHLQRPRWYPTSAILANGSIFTMGGLDDNQKHQGSIEILPKPPGGDTVVNLDWFQATPNALYPFVTVLPSKNLFIGYYNKARILDPGTFATLSILPDMPGAVNDASAGRNYPYSGAFVPLPLSAPYTDPLQIFICGGTTPSGDALDNCITLAPEASTPSWTLERMPSRRVIPCMVPLPDGTVLIVNGAHHGTAGFASATDPNFSAILYDPTQPLGSRFSILANTTIARMYHSEATLLTDGRVLISGSDPLDSHFPEEYRVEVFIPPYLASGLKQPTFSLSIKDWSYGSVYLISNIRLFQGSLNAIRISLVSAPSSTHGNAMGARTLFPSFSCTELGCFITAPPNSGVCPPAWYQLFILDGPTPSASQWVRIGGDPSQLGNWPDLPGFTRPGV